MDEREEKKNWINQEKKEIKKKQLSKSNNSVMDDETEWKR